MTIEEKILRLQTMSGYNDGGRPGGQVKLNCCSSWVSSEQMLGAIGRVTCSGGKTLDEALDNLILAVEAKDNKARRGDSYD